ncbi:MAG: carboxypeptidase regulatory-like domain-containing protein [Candidatus Kapabacteria bacterium]|nr:carboxypeptidase regulatory-like domain-containing protein [Candidatus Kapabacteria bacterium]
MKSFKNPLKVLSLAILLVLFTSSMFAQKPQPPSPYNVTVVTQKTMPPTDIVVNKWSYQWDSSKSTVFIIYMANGDTRDPKNFKQAQMLKMMPGQTDYSYSFQNLKVGVYSFYMTAAWFNFQPYIESDPSQFFTIEVKYEAPIQYYVRFVKFPPEINIALGQTFTIQLPAESNTNCPIVYNFKTDMPGKMTFDPNKGVVTMSASQNGKFMLNGSVSLKGCDSTLRNDIQIPVIVGNSNQRMPCAWIHGNVYNQKDPNTPINGGIVSIVPMLNSGQPVQAKIINGIFDAMVLEGVYILKLEAPNFQAVYYDNTGDFKLAKQITIKCNDTVMLKTTLTPLIPPTTHTVSGLVARAKDSSPVMGAMVQFTPYDMINNKSTTDPNVRTYTCATDQLGKYSIALPDNLIYVGFASAQKTNTDLQPCYYDGVGSPLEADLIVPEMDLQGIDFYLKAAVNTLANGFTGNVISDSGVALQSKLMAILVKPAPNTNNVKYNFVQTIQTDDKGNFRFANLPYGDYVVMSLPIQRQYVPGYYKANDLVTQKWRDATRITVNDAMPQIVYTLTHRTSKSWKGVAFVGGNISTQSGITLKKGNIPQGITPVQGALVYLMNENNEIVDYNFSDANGNFSIEELLAGKYTLITDKVGYDAVSQAIETDYDMKANVSLNVNLKSETLTVNDNNLNTLGMSFYPQPATSSLNVNFTGTDADAQFNIYDALGLAVLSGNFNAISGNNYLPIDVSTLSNGLFIIRINIAGKSQSAKFTVIK